MALQLPTDENRLAVIGMTGSGKTIGGLWHLSLRSWPSNPWIIIDYKRDASIAQIPGLTVIDVNRPPPRAAGIYAVQPMPDEIEEIDAFLWKVWSNGNTGIFIDEGYMLDRFSKPLRAILTQGRSLRVPVIALSQRPSWISPYLLSESEYLQLYHIHNPRDIKVMREWIPYTGAMPAHNSYGSIYFSVPQARVTLLKPVPPLPTILQTIEDRRPKRRRPRL